MKKIVVGIVFAGLAIFGYAFTFKNSGVLKENNEKAVSGIDFKHIGLEDAKKLAKETKKLIFIDIHTSWCGPCKLMAKGPFMDTNVAKVYNSKFINLKIDAEKDPDGPLVSRTYAVRAYPTMIFIDGNGKLLKTVIGYQNAEALLMHAEMRK